MPSQSATQFPDVHTLEHCAKALWEHTAGSKYREWFPWDSDHPEARACRLRAVERASVVLQALGELLPAEPEPEVPDAA